VFPRQTADPPDVGSCGLEGPCKFLPVDHRRYLKGVRLTVQRTFLILHSGDLAAWLLLFLNVSSFSLYSFSPSFLRFGHNGQGVDRALGPVLLPGWDTYCGIFKFIWPDRCYLRSQ
jgi:hypothetical protein